MTPLDNKRYKKYLRKTRVNEKYFIFYFFFIQTRGKVKKMKEKLRQVAESSIGSTKKNSHLQKSSDELSQTANYPVVYKPYDVTEDQGELHSASCDETMSSKLLLALLIKTSDRTKCLQNWLQLNISKKTTNYFCM